MNFRARMSRVKLLSFVLVSSIGIAMLNSVGFAAADTSAEIKELFWQDLIPEDFVQPENPFMSMSQEEIDKLLDGSPESNAELERLQAEFSYAPTVDALDGQRIKMPAYVTPLEFDGQMKLSEFLLVPYLGACMHSPPPPSNQIVHAIPEEAIEIDELYSPVWVIGKMRVESIESDLAEAGYQIDVEKIMPYR